MVFLVSSAIRILDQAMVWVLLTIQEAQFACLCRLPANFPAYWITNHLERGLTLIPDWWLFLFKVLYKLISVVTRLLFIWDYIIDIKTLMLPFLCCLAWWFLILMSCIKLLNSYMPFSYLLFLGHQFILHVSIYFVICLIVTTVNVSVCLT